MILFTHIQVRLSHIRDVLQFLRVHRVQYSSQPLGAVSAFSQTERPLQNRACVILWLMILSRKCSLCVWPIHITIQELEYKYRPTARDL